MSEVLAPGVLAGMLTGKPPRRDTYEGWQHYRATRESFTPAPKLSFAQWRDLSPHRRSLYDLHRTATHVNLPLQETPMSLRVSRLVNRRMRNNALKQKPATRAGVMVTGWGYQGKTETVCEVAASFEDAWLEMHGHLNPAAVEGTWDLHAPVVYVQTPVTAKPKSTCQAVLNFFGASMTSMNLPQLIQQVARSLHDHGVKALILDDITRLRMHRADDQDTLDLIRAFMSMNVTLVLVGVDIPGSGLLREARWDGQTRQWVMPSSEHARVHGFETTQTERRFDLVELDHFRYTTPDEVAAFEDHLGGLEGQLRLLKAKTGMLTGGSMPEYLIRRTGGVVGLLERLIEDGAQEAMDSGKEFLDEDLLDEIVISLDDPGRDHAAGEVPAIPQQASSPKRSAVRGRRRNTVYDDRGPRAAGS
ncbi:AAA family ATPase [Streptomyces sp. NPDC058525]|uniref:AAA family ATPase n=1 Tax=Streptomyces sp. NPDC058525 TaxID=3346538 RepID=UPI00365F776E